MVTSGDWQVIWSGLSAGSELSSVQLLSCVWLCDARLSCPSPTPGACSNSCPLSQLMPSISSSVVPFSAFNLSQHQGLFQWVSSSHQVVKVLEFQLQHQSFQWIFRTEFPLDEWLNILAVQGTLKSLLQLYNSKPSILQCADLCTVQLSHPYMTTGKTIAWTRQTFVGKVMKMLFNMLSMLEKAIGNPLQYSCLENPMDRGAW